MATSLLFKVFVYGTLKRGEPNFHVLSTTKNGFSQFLSEGQTTKKYPLVIGTRYNIPFLLNRPGTGNFITGEIFMVDEKMLGELDKLEDYPTWYDRELQDFDIIGSGKKEQAWVYIMKTFPEKMLSLPFLTTYKNSELTPYKESEDDYMSKADIDEFNENS